jgi:hypothetical protein
MVGVYKTSVTENQVKFLQPLLNVCAGEGNWNFALDDADRILRVVASSEKNNKTVQLLRECGFECEELPD